MNKTFRQNLFKNHTMAMAFMCILPMAGIAALTWLGVLGSWGFYALFLLCPVSHILMMRGMHSGHQEVKVKQRIEQVEPE